MLTAHTQATRKAHLAGTPTGPCRCGYTGPQWRGATWCAHCGGTLPTPTHKVAHMPTHPVHTTNASSAPTLAPTQLTPMQARALRQVQLHHANLLNARRAVQRTQQVHTAAALHTGATLGGPGAAVRRARATRAAKAHGYAQAQLRAAQHCYSATLRAAVAQGVPRATAQRSAHALGMASIRGW
jgi:hypothetical protein